MLCKYIYLVNVQTMRKIFFRFCVLLRKSELYYFHALSLGLPLQEDLPTYIIMRPLRLLKLYKGQNTTNTTIMKDMTLFRFKMFQENKTGPSPSPQNKMLGKVTNYSYLHRLALISTGFFTSFPIFDNIFQTTYLLF